MNVQRLYKSSIYLNIYLLKFTFKSKVTTFIIKPKLKKIVILFPKNKVSILNFKLYYVKNT